MAVAVTATVSDPDGQRRPASPGGGRNPSTETGTYSDISGATNASHTPASGDLNQWLKVKASYTDGHGSGKDGGEYAQTGADAENAHQAPAFANASETLTVAENAACRHHGGHGVGQRFGRRRP